MKKIKFSRIALVLVFMMTFMISTGGMSTRAYAVENDEVIEQQQDVQVGNTTEEQIISSEKLEEGDLIEGEVDEIDTEQEENKQTSTENGEDEEQITSSEKLEEGNLIEGEVDEIDTEQEENKQTSKENGEDEEQITSSEKLEEGDLIEGEVDEIDTEQEENKQISTENGEDEEQITSSEKLEEGDLIEGEVDEIDTEQEENKQTSIEKDDEDEQISAEGEEGISEETESEEKMNETTTEEKKSDVMVPAEEINSVEDGSEETAVEGQSPAETPIEEVTKTELLQLERVENNAEEIEEKTINLEVGDEEEVPYKVDGYKFDNWQGDSSIASIKEKPFKRKIVANGVGTTTITVTYRKRISGIIHREYDYKSVSYKIEVKAKPVTGVTITEDHAGWFEKESFELLTNKNKKLYAQVEPKNATNKNVTWSSDNEKVATVENGLVTSLNPGKAIITVTTKDGNKTDTCEVTVKPRKDDICAGDIKFINPDDEHKQLEARIDETIQLNFRVKNTDNSGSWGIDHWFGVHYETMKIEFSNGIETQIKDESFGYGPFGPGDIVDFPVKYTVKQEDYDNSEDHKLRITATVTAVCKSNIFGWKIIEDTDTSTIEITIKPKDVVKPEINLNENILELIVGNISTLTADKKPQEASVIWKTSDEKIATVENGKVSAVSPGKVNITAIIEVDGKEYSSICEVTVKPERVSVTGSTNGLGTVTVTGATEGATLNLYRRLSDEEKIHIGEPYTWKENQTEYKFKNVSAGNDYYVTQTVNGIESNPSNPVNVTFSKFDIFNKVTNNLDGTYTAVWGYKNNTAKQIIVNKNNSKFNKKGAKFIIKGNKKPLNVFEKGTYDTAFTTTFYKKNLVWTLKCPDGEKITSIAEAGPEAEISEVGTSEDIKVKYGTKLENIEFPATVKCALMIGNVPNNEGIDVEVEWREGQKKYDGNKAGEYEFEGTLSPPKGVKNTEKVATIKVIVDSEPYIPPYIPPTPSNPDETPPVITLEQGTEIVELEVGSGQYDVRSNVTALDNKDGDITNSIEVTGTVDTSESGEYTLKYNVKDKANNSADEVIRTVKVVNFVKNVNIIKDIPVPYGTSEDKIGLPENVQITLSDGSKPEIPVTWDNSTPQYDGKIAKKYEFAGKLDLSKLQYVKETELKAKVNVIVAPYESNGTSHKSHHSSNNSDTTNPVITLIGDSKVILEFGADYKDAGATAEDNKDGDITNKIEIGGDKVDTNKAGNYNITYNVKDSAGNKADEVKRTVVVEDEVIIPAEPEIPEGTPDKKKPVITLNGDSEINLNLGEKYEELGVTAVDDVDGDITDKIEISINGKDEKVNTDKEGTYVITYKVSDKAGNKADEVVRTVVVKSIEEDKEIVVPSDKVPEGTPNDVVKETAEHQAKKELPVLPKTGGQSPLINYITGAFIVLLGLKIRKNTKADENE
ncbi:immunoglobulin-like domain-containing protein [Clostridium ganghwense]|uniref:DUF5011 domain-containing protein n=1 Tax=Clostridium ganghwense TaxID=312089 RepID=A0ABT4CQN8_9CLOT|nr:immunoglobulin-like domain-containing protein [Clostridium ganghwense]MCY6371370.1 DUF5011 domain-containing protein [Clostridium ganghwense]